MNQSQVKKPFAPWLQMSPLLAMNEPEQMMSVAAPIPDLPKMAQAATPMPEQSAPAPQAPMPAPEMPPMPQGMKAGQSMSTTTKQTVTNPTIEAEAERLRNQMEEMRQARMSDEQGAIDDYSNRINQYESQATGIDWRPLAGMLDQWAGGKMALNAAEATKPEAPELKRDKLNLMREKLSAMKGGLSKSQYDAVKDQLDSLKAQMNSEAAEKRLMYSMTSKERGQERLENNDIEKQVLDMSKRLGDANAIVITQKIDRLNKNIPGGLFGKGEIPGIGIGKNWSPQFLFTDEGSTIRQDAKALLVESIKAATGLAATEAEQQAQAQINGLSKSSTAREFREALAKQLQDNFARSSEIIKTYRPEAQEVYRKRQGGKTVADVLDSINKSSKPKRSAPTPAEIDAMSPEELKQFLSE